jgi:hypothetical protein
MNMSGNVSIGGDAAAMLPAGILVTFTLTPRFDDTRMIGISASNGPDAFGFNVVLSEGAATYPLAGSAELVIAATIADGGADGGEWGSSGAYPAAGALVVQNYSISGCEQDPTVEGMLGTVACVEVLDATATINASNDAGVTVGGNFSIHYRTAVDVVACE